MIEEKLQPGKECNTPKCVEEDGGPETRKEIAHDSKKGLGGETSKEGEQYETKGYETHSSTFRLFY
jgi:hypothetical protein